MASFLAARAANGLWLVRIDDLDPPREQDGASDMIIEALDKLGLNWDRNILFQSDLHDGYQSALKKLSNAKRTFPCGCTRREIAGRPYQGTCRAGVAPGRIGRSIRFRVSDVAVGFNDRIYGAQSQQLETEVGDFNLVRADGLYAYHLAVVVDDAAAAVTEVVRGVDLLDSTPRQIALQQALGLSTPSYCHFPVACDKNGVKLSKQSGAQALDLVRPSAVWYQVLEFLNQNPPATLREAALSSVQQWALAHWDVAKIRPIAF